MEGKGCEYRQGPDWEGLGACAQEVGFYLLGGGNWHGCVLSTGMSSNDFPCTLCDPSKGGVPLPFSTGGT